MKAVILSKYGPPENLEIKDVEIPAPKKNEVLIKVKFTAINDYDWSMVRGKPYLYRLLFGLLKPKHRIPGMELSGVVESVGDEVKSLKPGDAVFGDISDCGFGTFAEYVSVDEGGVIKKPEGISFNDASALPHASLLALQGLRDLGNIKEDLKILINGAGGGVGPIGVQIAKIYNCEVTGVDSGDKLDLMGSIGFDHVIDYTKDDFTKNGQKYDLILDCKTTRSPFSYLRSLNPGGIYITVGGALHRILQLLIFKKIISLFNGKTLNLLGLKANKGLDHISNLCSQGKIKPVIDGPYQLEDVPRLIQYFGEGKHTGKVIINING